MGVVCVLSIERNIMDNLEKYQLEELFHSAPGSFLKLAMDDMLTILFAPETFFALIKKEADKTPPDIKSLLKLVYSTDVIYVTQQLAAQKHRKDNMLRFQFRTLQSDGSFKWIMISGIKMQEIYSVGAKSVPIYACIAVDVTDFMLQFRRLEQLSDYNRAITELSKDLYFEYEIATDTLSFTEAFREKFGKEAIVQDFRERLKKTKIIHPEELPAVVKIFNSMMSGRKQVRFELRLIPKGGKPCWYICYASIIFDENKTPIKVVGKLSIVNHVVTEQEQLTLEPVLDSVTGVHTKESMELFMIEALKKQKKDSLSAFMLVEIRNYEDINEVRKTINGENILETSGAILREHIRTTDIIGRMAGGEFAILIKDIPTDRIAYDIAEQLCSALEAQYSYKHTKSGLIISIGIAFIKGEQDYQTILANASVALMLAKKVSTSSFEVYS
jgi:diguanylate cyclase (GGDEF)-like protein